MDTTDDVRAAQAGDREAFRRLVARFQPVVAAYALAWVPEAAEDVAQEAFADAFLHLDQLREPQAFAAWLRRIVRKHCDRRTRRRLPRPPGELAVSEPDEHGPDRDEMLRAVAGLPEHERIVVAMHYLGGEPQKDVADFLQPPLSTIKKRLHSARARLRGGLESRRAEPLAGALAERIALFLAVRAGEVAQASSLLERQPKLLEAEEAWSTEEALGAGLPIAHRVTPLILAAGRGDVPMVRMLLERGADANRRCGCDNGETALWIAERAGHHEVSQLLLTAGADPRATNAAGLTPSQAAALVPAYDVRLAGERFETGIKAIDVLAPLERGMLVRVRGEAGTGLMVLMAELTARFGDAVWLWSPTRPWQRGDLEAFAAESRIQPQMGGDYAGRSLFVFADEGQAAAIDAELPRFRAARIAFVIDNWADAMRAPRSVELTPPYQALLATDPELARAGIYPAIDRKSSRSLARLDPEHAAIAGALRATDRERTLGFFAQPFEVYRHRNGKPGEYWSTADALAGFAERL